MFRSHIMAANTITTLNIVLKGGCIGIKLFTAHKANPITMIAIKSAASDICVVFRLKNEASR